MGQQFELSSIFLTLVALFQAEFVQLAPLPPVSPSTTSYPSLADVALAVSLSASVNTPDMDDANHLIRKLSIELWIGYDNIRLAVLSNVVNNRVRIQSSLSVGHSVSTISKLRIDPWTNMGINRQTGMRPGPIFDRLDDDVFNGKKLQSGDREEAPNLLIYYAVVPEMLFLTTLNEIRARANESDFVTEVIILSTGRLSSNQSHPVIGKIWYQDASQYRHGVKPTEMLGVNAILAMEELAKMINHTLRDSLRMCDYELNRKRCYWVKPADEFIQPCPCVYQINVTIRSSSSTVCGKDCVKKYCPKAISELPCEQDRVPYCSLIKWRLFPAWIFIPSFLTVGMLCCVYCCLLSPCGAVYRFKAQNFKDEMEEKAIELILERIIAGTEDAIIFAADQGEQPEEEEEVVEQEETEEEVVEEDAETPDEETEEEIEEEQDEQVEEFMKKVQELRGKRKKKPSAKKTAKKPKAKGPKKTKTKLRKGTKKSKLQRKGIKIAALKKAKKPKLAKVTKVKQQTKLTKVTKGTKGKKLSKMKSFFKGTKKSKTVQKKSMTPTAKKTLINAARQLKKRRQAIMKGVRIGTKIGRPAAKVLLRVYRCARFVMRFTPGAP